VLGRRIGRENMIRRVGMTFVRVSLCVFLLALLAMPAVAEDWKRFYDTGGEKYYFDKESIRAIGPKRVAVWQKITTLGLDREEIERNRAEVEINCKERTYRVITATALDPVTGKEAKPEELPDGSRFRTDLMGAPIAALTDNVCP
jgi:hypothetical protein